MDSTALPRVRQAVHDLDPGYFALVMGTGIVSVGMRLRGFTTLSELMLAVCAAAFAVLVVLTLWRLVGFPGAVMADLTDPARGFGFLTFVAGANVLGVRLAMDGRHAVTAVLLGVSATTWLVLGYLVPWTAVLGRTQRPVLATANGTWFVWVVASQSVAVSAASLQPQTGWWRAPLATAAVFCWSVGVFLYAAAGTFVAARMMLYELRPTDLTPSYWVAMGACAITVLAGSRIVEMAAAPMVAATRGLIAGSSVLFWAFATWLIPVLTAAGWWRHRVHRVPMVYQPTLWSIVFPLGMYAVAGIYLGQADDLPVVGTIGAGELWVAFAAWVLTFAAMVANLVRSLV